MTDNARPEAVTRVLERLGTITPRLESLYKDLHEHPELSYAETRTAAVVAAELKQLGFTVTEGVGRTGVVGVLSHGEGPRVLLRADFDALPVAEQTGLPYASTATGVGVDGQEVPVMHACGHDMHVACLLGALDLLAGARDDWSGTVVAVFQPAEELGTGARAMVDDGLFDMAGVPDVVLGQHVAPVPAGIIGCRPGPAMAGGDTLHVRMFGRGGHGSRPEMTVDPVVMAASTVMRLQTVVSREIAGSETAVVTVGAINAGTKDNIIPDEAELKLNIRSFTPEVRTTVMDAVARIVRAEALASGADREPEIESVASFPVLVNDAHAVERTMGALRTHFGAESVIDPGVVTGSEDCGFLATASGAALCYWFFGGMDPARYLTAAKNGTLGRDIPSNHSPLFAPVVGPTVDAGVRAMTTAALAWLGQGGSGGPATS
ncbi:amidohydrolase [Streptomyces beijiangensis]|uniref:Amidohydrolase n=1 Tax=Streptomyces beijiangensis TaxID=163361 RepID=A0A939JGZ9_9ACTN|nr:amidohydrolase [Streptomyces beijiangensis]MBO0512087.1 amidohydrolase [Streptomyces beijiangensis]